MTTKHHDSLQTLPELATKAQVAAFAQVSERTIRRLVARRAIPFVRVGAQLRFPGDAIRAAFLKEPRAI